MPKIVCFGEVLFDIFPDKKIIGGAPLNVALRLHSFGHSIVMISAVGKDALGMNILNYLKDKNIDISQIQINDTLKTGEVAVSLNSKGSASYKINYPRAWDNIVLNQKIINSVTKSDALVFGSLAARDTVSKNTLCSLIEYSKYKIFDVNLRPPHYSSSVLFQLMEKADFIKMNDDELYEVCALFNSKYKSLEQNLKFIAHKTNTNHICVTKGEHGAVLLYDGVLYYNSGYQIKVIDTVGAGDSFLGSLISQLLLNIDPQKAINFACAVGALVAQKEGANPKLSSLVINNLINPK